MKFVIDRAKWKCGSGGNERGVGYTQLLNSDGYMCCLGAVASQLGAKRSEILDTCSPEYLDRKLPILCASYRIGVDNSKLSLSAMVINDSPTLTDKEREQKLKSLFSKFKHKIIFKGLYRDVNGKVLKK